MKNLNKKFSLYLMGFMTVLGFINFGLGGAASASTCSIPNIVDHNVTYTPRYYSQNILNGFGNVIATRGFCTRVSINGDYNGWYRFAVVVQDTVDVPANAYRNDDQGQVTMQYTTPGTNVWHNLVSDQNSANFTPNQSTNGNVWYSQWFHAVIHGSPRAFTFRESYSTHYSTNVGPWSWATYNTGTYFISK